MYIFIQFINIEIKQIDKLKLPLGPQKNFHSFEEYNSRRISVRLCNFNGCMKK